MMLNNLQVPIFRYQLLWEDWCWSNWSNTARLDLTKWVSASLMKPFDLTACCRPVEKGSWQRAQYANLLLASHTRPQNISESICCAGLFSTDCNHCNPPQLSWELEHLPKQAWASCTCEICWCETTSQRPLLKTCLKIVQTLTSCVEYKLWAVPSSNVLLPKEHQGLLHFCAWQMGLPQTLGWTGFIDRIKIN